MKMKPLSGPLLFDRMSCTDTRTASGLAAAAGISRASATKVLRGETVSISTASRVADALGSTVADLFENGATE